MIKQLVDNYLKAAQKLSEATGILIGISDLVCSFNGFKRLIETNDLKPIVVTRDNDSFPYEAFVEIEGFKFTTLLTKYEYETYMKGMVA